MNDVTENKRDYQSEDSRIVSKITQVLTIILAILAAIFMIILIMDIPKEFYNAVLIVYWGVVYIYWRVRSIR